MTIELFAKFTTNILFIHFGGWFYSGARESRRTIAALGKQNSVRVLVGYDGLELDLNDL